MSRLAIIPARGGSKRIPKKNIKPFLGKPIIAYSIEAALKSELFDEVIVSTDSKEIEEIALNYGAKVPFKRSEKNSNDYATTFDVINEVIEEYEKLGKSFNFVCCIYACAPFVTKDILKKGVDLLESENFDCVFPAVEYAAPIQRAFVKKENGKMEMLHPEHLNSRSQDLEACFHDAGQFYWMQYNKLKDQRKLWTDNTGIIPINEGQGHDIDTETDWKIAEIKYQLFDTNKNQK